MLRICKNMIFIFNFSLKYFLILISLNLLTNCARNARFTKEIASSISNNSTDNPDATQTPIPSLLPIETSHPIITPTPAPTKTPTPILTPTPPPKLDAEISGVVKSAIDGKTLSGVTITLTSTIDGFKPVTIMNSGIGLYSFPKLGPGIYSLKFSRPGYITYIPSGVLNVSESDNVTLNSSLSPILLRNNLRIVLTWGDQNHSQVGDVDSYLKISDDPYPIFWQSKNGNGANLDVDDTNFNGPETITITNQRPGISYTYYVVNFNNFLIDALGKSNVKVALYQGTIMLQEFLIPQGRGIQYKLFTLKDGIIKNDARYLAYPTSKSLGYCNVEGLIFKTGTFICL